MVTAVEVLRIIVPVLYALAAANSILMFVRNSPRACRVSLPLLGTTVGLHAVYLGLAAATLRRCPLGTVFEAMGLMALALTTVYFILEVRGGTRPTGILILPLACVLELVGTAFPNTSDIASPNLANPWFSLHAVSAIFGVCALGVSFVHGVFYLLLYRQISKGQFGVLFKRLPPLEDLQKMTSLASVVGWTLLTVTIVAGGAWARQSDRLAEAWTDPMFIATVGVWVLYGVGIVIRYVTGWRGRFSVYLSVYGFSFLLLFLLVSSFVLPSMHEYR